MPVADKEALMKRYPGFAIICILLLTSCTPSRIIQQIEVNSSQIKKFNYDAFERGGSVRLKDSSTYAGHQFRLTDSSLTWIDSSTQKKLSVSPSEVFSVDLIKKANPRDAAGGAVKGILVGGAVGALFGRVTTPYKPETVDREESNVLEVIAATITMGIVGAVVGGFIGASSNHHDTRITKIFKTQGQSGNYAIRPVEVLKRTDDSSLASVNASATTNIISKQAGLPDKHAPIITQSATMANKTVFGGLSWSLSNTIIPVYVGAKSLRDKSYRAVPIGYGLVIGPSIGHFYASDKKRGLIGIAARAAGFAMYVIGKGHSEGMKTAGIVLISAGIGYSLYTVPSSVREYNARQNWSVAPLIDPKQKSLSLALQIQM